MQDGALRGAVLHTQSPVRLETPSIKKRDKNQNA